LPATSEKKKVAFDVTIISTINHLLLQYVDVSREEKKADKK